MTEFVITLVLEFQNITIITDDKTKYSTFYSNSKVETIFNESYINDIFESIYINVTSNIQIPIGNKIQKLTKILPKSLILKT